MMRIPVHASKSYDIVVERNLLDKIGELCRPVASGEVMAIVTDDTVNELYGDRAEASLKAAGYRTLRVVFPSGEASKNTDTYLTIIHALAKNHVSRNDTILALGGGVVGDMAGFAAATYLRGISFIQVPTTLLSAVDSSVGGKTAVDLPEGKNLLGAFWQPSLVVCDPELLQTLPADIYADGMAEVIKYGMIRDAAFFARLEAGDLTVEEIIATCVAIKRDVVAMDEYDNGIRQILNFGHTFGHSVEAGSNFQILHGHGVAIGMMLIARALREQGSLSAESVERLSRVLKKYELPTECPFEKEALLKTALTDKKRRNGTIGLVLVHEIGDAFVKKIPIEDMGQYLVVE